MDFPSISVVMSVYNGEAFLAEALESVLSQTYRDFEFVIIDDGSTDRTTEILADYGRRDARIRIHRHENKGRAESLNAGIALAKGKYIARMDADDVALPERLKKQVAFMDEHPDVGLLGGAVELMHEDGEVFNVHRPPLSDREIRLSLQERNSFCHPAMMMRKEVVLASGGYRKALLDADDYDLFLRMGDRSKFANLADVILRYRVHDRQVSIQNMTHQTLCVLAARAAAARRERGQPDPLCQVAEVTEQLVYSLGVTSKEVQRALQGVYLNWLEVLQEKQPDSALRAIEQLLILSKTGCVARPTAANAWLAAAAIHYKQRRYAKALGSVGKAVWTRPMVIGRPVKRALAGLANALKNYSQ